jgi:hypothetical protein
VTEVPAGVSEEEIQQKLLAWYGQQQQQQAAPEEEEEGFWKKHGKGAFESFRSGMFAGFNDELEGIGSIVNPNKVPDVEGGARARYEASRDATREAMELFGKDHPMLKMALEFGGGMITGGALMKMLQMARGGKQSLILGGAAQGALTGVGTGETAEERAQGGVLGGVLGAGAGAAGKVVERFIPGVGTRAQAAEEVLGGRSLKQAQQQLRELQEGFENPWARFMHVEPGGAEMGYLGASPAMRKQTEQALVDLQRRQGELVEDAARNITGVSASRTDADNAILARRQQEAREMYEPLRGAAVDLSPKLRETLDTPAGQAAADATLQALRNQRRNPDLSLEDVQGDFDFWHGYQQVLRDMSNRQSVSSRPLSSLEASSIGGMRDDVMSELFGQEDWGASYAAATARFRENSEIMEALTDSEKFAKLSRDKLSAALGKLETDEERTAFASGVVNDLIEKALTTGDETGNVSRTLLKSPALRQKLSMVLGDEKMDDLEEAMRKISKIAETRGQVLGNSRTAERQARQTRVGEEPSKAAAVLRSIANVQPGDALAQLFDAGAMGTIPEAVADDMLRVALSMSPEELASALAKLQAASKGWRTGVGATVGGASSLAGSFTGGGF